MLRLLICGSLLFAHAGCTFEVRGTAIDIDGGPVELDLAMVDGASDGADGGGCDPAGRNDHCSDDKLTLLICRADGTGFTSLGCPFQCGTTGGAAHCQSLEPSGAVMASDYALPTATTTISTDAVFNTDDGSITGGLQRAAGAGVKGGIFYREVVQTGSNVKVGVFGFAGLTVAAGVVVRARGNDALVIVSSKDVAINGALDLQGQCTNSTVGAAGGAGGMPTDMVGGAGGGVGGGAGGGVAMGAKASGGGGGGYGDNGGRGGNTTSVPGAVAGSLFGDLVIEPVVIMGGGGGGAGGSAGTVGGAGGNGGGAVQISVNGALTIAGTIQAGGCGGRASEDVQSSGGGGGAGGTILIEAATVQLSNGSILVANGGGGGGAGTGAGPGGNASLNASPAIGGVTGTGGSAGGSGGVRLSTAGANGGDVAAAIKVSGGGGGAVGRIAIKTLSGNDNDQGATLSPDVSDQNAAGKKPCVITKATFQ